MVKVTVSIVQSPNSNEPDEASERAARDLVEALDKELGGYGYAELATESMKGSIDFETIYLLLRITNETVSLVTILEPMIRNALKEFRKRKLDPNKKIKIGNSSNLSENAEDDEKIIKRLLGIQPE